MKQLTTILFILIVFLQTFSRFVVEANYFINRDFIASTLCENMAKPEMKCHGKCFMARQLKEHQKQDNESPVSKKSKIEIPVCIVLEPIQLNRIEEQIKLTFNTRYTIDLPTFPRSLFHPPGAKPLFG